MKTINERTKEFCNKCRKSQPYCPCTPKERHNCLIYDAYYHGAIEQWQEDNKQLCEMVLDNQQALIDKACEFWHKALVNDKSMWLALIEKFRKEMTTEEKEKGLHTPEDLLHKTKSTQEYIDSLVGTESTSSPVDDLALNDMADAAFKERTADMSIPILADSSFFFKEGFVMGYNQAKAIYYQHMIYLADACEHDKALLIDKACNTFCRYCQFDCENHPHDDCEILIEYKATLKGGEQ